MILNTMQNNPQKLSCSLKTTKEQLKNNCEQLIKTELFSDLLEFNNKKKTINSLF